MKITFENLIPVRYFLENPIKSVIFVVAVFSFSISVDQAFLGGKSQSIFKEEVSLNNYETYFSSTYVGLISTTPQIVSYYKDAKTCTNESTEVAYFENVRTVIINTTRFINLQIQLLKKLNR